MKYLTRKTVSTVALTLATLAVTLATTGCATSGEEQAQVGSLKMNLVTTSTSGNTYRLDGIFTVTQGGFVVAELDTASDPDATTLTLDLEPGDYEIQLHSWGMQKLESGVYGPVPADPISSLTQTFSVAEGATTNVSYQFKVFGELAVLGGSLAVSTEVVEELCNDDAAEDNDDTATAVHIAFRESYEATICPLDADYYRFDAIVGEYVTARLSFVHADGDLDLQILDENFAALDSSAGVTDNEVAEVPAFPTAVGYIRVDGFRRAGGDYSLSLSEAPAAWTCPTGYYTDSECDCGCGAADPSCAAITTVAECQYNNCVAPTPNVDPSNFALCVP